MSKTSGLEVIGMNGGGVWVRSLGIDGKEKVMGIAGLPLATFEAALKAWRDGALIQDAFPMLDADQREFLKTGITPDEWDAMLKEDEDDDRHQECDGCGADTGHKVGFCEACEAERKESLAIHAGTDNREAQTALLDTEAVAKLTTVSVSSLTKWRCAGRGPTFLKLGSRVMYRRDDVLKWMGEQVAQIYTDTHGSPELDADARKLEAMGQDAGPTLDDLFEADRQPIDNANKSIASLLNLIDANQEAWEGEEDSVKEEHAELIGLNRRMLDASAEWRSKQKGWEDSK